MRRLRLLLMSLGLGLATVVVMPAALAPDLCTYPPPPPEVLREHGPPQQVCCSYNSPGPEHLPPHEYYNVGPGPGPSPACTWACPDPPFPPGQEVGGCQSCWNPYVPEWTCPPPEGGQP